MDYRNRFPWRTWLAIANPTAEREIRNVDLMFAQYRADLPDYAGDVTVAHEDQIALEWGFHINTIHVEQSWGVLVQDGAFDHMLSAGRLE